MFERFQSSGKMVKKRLEKLLSDENYKDAEVLANDSLKDCKAFLQKLDPKSDKCSTLETSIAELSKLIDDLKNKSVEKYICLIFSKPETSSEKTNDSEGKKYYKTKILSEDVRDTATRIAETDLKFDDFPKSAFGFEKAFNTLKNKSETFFLYLTHLQPENLASIHQSNELTYQALAGILKSINENGLKYFNI